jgi:tripartite-type tricarboxylate transporter receptor subunit TctC
VFNLEHPMKLTRKILLAMACLGVASTTALAQSPASYPERPVKIVVPWAAGGFTDRLGRMLAEKMTKSVGQTVLVENRPGASGSIGSESVARAAPDGYTLLLTTSDSTVRLMQDKRIDAASDFVQISLLATQPVYLAVGPNMPAKTIGEFIGLARKRPGEITYASSGEGSAVHLAMELFASAAGIRLNHIPYKGMGPALTDLLGGQVDAVLLSMQGSAGNFETGRLRPLAITSPTRSNLMPAVPTIAESGVPSYQLMLWYGLVAPKGTPQAIIDKLNREVKSAIAQPDIQSQLKEGGTDPIGSSPAELATFVGAELVKWGPVIK